MSSAAHVGVVVTREPNAAALRPFAILGAMDQVHQQTLQLERVVLLDRSVEALA
jgi:hypothetical protein